MKNNFLLLFVCLFPMGLFSQNWEPFNTGTNQSVRALYFDSSENLLYLSGIFSKADGFMVNGIASWDGSNFETLDQGIDNCNPISCSFSPGPFKKFQGDLYIGTPFKTVSGITVNGIARWDGNSWYPLQDGVQFGDGSYGFVSAMEVFNNSLYVFGSFQLAGGIPVQGMARWDGENWYSIDAPNVEADLWLPYEAITFQNELYIIGNFLFDFPQNQKIEDIIKFDGANWHRVADNYFGSNSELGSITIYNNQIYVGGLISDSRFRIKFG